MEKNQIKPKPLPTFAEVYNGLMNPAEAFKNDEWNSLLNMPPNTNWIKKFPEIMKIKGEYMPIDKVDLMLKIIFGRTKIEVRSVQLILNSIQVTIRIHYKDPNTDEWDFQDGVGAAPLQVDSGQPAANITALKSRAVQIATPIAKSAAKKDAAEELGRIFGSDLNRKDTIMIAGGYEPEPPQATAPTTNWQANPYGQPQQPATNGHTQQPSQFTQQPSPSFNFSAL